MSIRVFSWIAKRGLVSSKQCFGCDGSKLTNDPVAFPHGGHLNRRIDEADTESSTLAALRDTLLPKLISGDLRVNDAERFVEMIGA